MATAHGRRSRHARLADNPWAPRAPGAGQPVSGDPHMSKRSRAAASIVALLITATSITGVFASSHREAPLISGDPGADNTDLYAFVSPDNPDSLPIIANY